MDRRWVVTIRGFDVDNPSPGRCGRTARMAIAMWTIDTDSDEESSFFRNVGSLGADPYDRLRQALKAEINPERGVITSATSRLLTHPATGKIAIEGGRPYATSS